MFLIPNNHFSLKLSILRCFIINGIILVYFFFVWLDITIILLFTNREKISTITKMALVEFLCCVPEFTEVILKQLAVENDLTSYVCKSDTWKPQEHYTIDTHRILFRRKYHTWCCSVYAIPHYRFCDYASCGQQRMGDQTMNVRGEMCALSQHNDNDCLLYPAHHNQIKEMWLQLWLLFTSVIHNCGNIEYLYRV